MKKVFLIVTCLVSVLALSAQNNKKVAIMETKTNEGVSSFQSNMVRGGMETAVANAPGYEGYDRAAFDVIMKEQNFQRSGAVDDKQIREMGIMAGVQYVLVTEASTEDGYFYILAKLLDVETGRFMKSAEQLCEVSPTKIKSACADIGVQLFGKNSSHNSQRVSEGALNGVFSVSSSTKVHFSRGNLQYKASTNTWRFAENQWNYVGGVDYISGDVCGNVYENGLRCDNSRISSSYNGWIDLFGWATSGFNHGAGCYQPYSISLDYEEYYAYGGSEYNLSDYSGNADWGYNAILNGGNATGQWRTLSLDEWNYILFQRNASPVNGIANARYFTGEVNGVLGLVLFPDVFIQSNNVNILSGINVFDYTNPNHYSIEEWAVLEKEGCVFLPVTGDRFGEKYRFNGNTYRTGNYWTETCANSGDAYYLTFYWKHISTDTLHNCDRGDGMSVRLVQDINEY